MNMADSEVVNSILMNEGMSPVQSAEEADVISVNTCSIREKAQEKVFSLLGKWKTWKQNKPDLLIGVGGCVASQEGDAIRQRAPHVDMVFGPQTLHRLPQMVKGVTIEHMPMVDISFPEIEKSRHHIFLIRLV